MWHAKSVYAELLIAYERQYVPPIILFLKSERIFILLNLQFLRFDFDRQKPLLRPFLPHFYRQFIDIPRFASVRPPDKISPGLNRTLGLRQPHSRYTYF